MVELIAHTDGACSGNPGPGGWGVLLEARKDGVVVKERALSGGEDYELLFTISPDDIDKVKYLPDIYIAGEIVPAREGVHLHTRGGNIHPIEAQGWKHFGSSNLEKGEE